MRGEEHFFPGSPGESQCVLGVGLEGQMGWVSSWQDPLQGAIPPQPSHSVQELS